MLQSEIYLIKTSEAATRLFPNEQWIGIDKYIFMAASRAPRSSRQSEILDQELSQARILAAFGHTVYLMPEFGSRKVKHPDAIADGLVMEFKTVSGNERKKTGSCDPAAPRVCSGYSPLKCTRVIIV